VASENNDTEDRIEAPHEPRECMACRATGRVISNLGGSPSSVTCPWCGGSGLRVPGIDAQARWVEEQGVAEPQAESSAEPQAEPSAEPTAEPAADTPGESPDSAA
jgi:hypothetical protein